MCLNAKYLKRSNKDLKKDENVDYNYGTKTQICLIFFHGEVNHLPTFSHKFLPLKLTDFWPTVKLVPTSMNVLNFPVPVPNIVPTHRAASTVNAMNATMNVNWMSIPASARTTPRPG